MFTMKMAGLVIQVQSENSRVATRCRDFMIPDALPDLSVAASDKYINEWVTQRPAISFDINEEGAFFYTLYERLLDYDAFSLHAVLLQADGEGYAFSAASGTGKSTHARRWLELLGDRASIVDGDHPILRMIDGQVFGFGNPFCGKEWFHETRGVPLKGICFLRRAEETSVEPMDPREAVLRFGWNDPCFHIEDETMSERQFDLYERIAERVPLYWVNMNNFQPGAANICYEAVSGRKL